MKAVGRGVGKEDSGGGRSIAMDRGRKKEKIAVDCGRKREKWKEAKGAGPKGGGTARRLGKAMMENHEM